MKALEIRGGEIFVGASVPHSKITKSKIVQDHANALAVACGLIGGPQVRNTATLGGNVGHALPAADGTIALTALDAEAEVASLEGCRRVPLEQLFAGPGKSTLDPRGELLVGFYVPLKESNQASVFKRIMRPQGVAIAILNTAVWLQRDNDIIADVHISMGPSGPVPRRLREIEDVLKGLVFSEESLNKGVAKVVEDANFRTSRHRSSKEYRYHMAGVLLVETLSMAWSAAQAAAGGES